MIIHSYMHNNELPFILKRAKGAYLYDYTHKKYLDFLLCAGSLIIGHAHPKATKAIKSQVSKGYSTDYSTLLLPRLTKIITKFYNQTYKHIRFYYSFQEVVSTLHKETESIIFLGEHYKEQVHQDFLTINPNTLQQIEDHIKTSKTHIDAICLEPFIGPPNLNAYPQDFLTSLNELITHYNLTVILDERRSAFRLHSLQAIKPIQASTIILGPVIGGGFPLYALMSNNNPNTTLCEPYPHIPLYYAAGIETLKQLKRRNNFSKHFTQLTTLLKEQQFKHWEIQTLHSLFTIKAKNSLYKNHEQICKHFQKHLILIHQKPSQCSYLSFCHTEKEILKLVSVLKKDPL